MVMRGAKEHWEQDRSAKEASMAENGLMEFYKEICTNIRATDEISFKILGAVPVISALGSGALTYLKPDLPARCPLCCAPSDFRFGNSRFVYVGTQEHSEMHLAYCVRRKGRRTASNCTAFAAGGVSAVSLHLRQIAQFGSHVHGRNLPFL
jgi:hypothetical protein